MEGAGGGLFSTRSKSCCCGCCCCCFCDVPAAPVGFGACLPACLQDLPTALLSEAFAEKPKEKKPDAKGDAKDGAGGDAAAAAAAAKKKKEAQKVELLDGKTLRNNGIVFKRFRCVFLSGLFQSTTWASVDNMVDKYQYVRILYVKQLQLSFHDTLLLYH